MMELTSNGSGSFKLNGKGLFVEFVTDSMTFVRPYLQKIQSSFVAARRFPRQVRVSKLDPSNSLDPYGTPEV